MPTEPEWSSSISNSSVCTWFFILAIIDAIIGVAVILLAMNMLLKSKISWVNVIMLSLGALGAFANSWFLFLICNRSLKAEGFGLDRSSISWGRRMNKMPSAEKQARILGGV